MGDHLYERAFVSIRYLRRYKRGYALYAVYPVPVSSAVGGQEGLESALRRLSGAHTSRQQQKKEPSWGGRSFKYLPPVVQNLLDAL
jgi:hypothetical protein